MNCIVPVVANGQKRLRKKERLSDFHFTYRMAKRKKTHQHWNSCLALRKSNNTVERNHPQRNIRNKSTL